MPFFESSWNRYSMFVAILNLCTTWTWINFEHDLNCLSCELSWVWKTRQISNLYQDLKCSQFNSILFDHPLAKDQKKPKFACARCVCIISVELSHMASCAHSRVFHHTIWPSKGGSFVGGAFWGKYLPFRVTFWEHLQIWIPCTGLV